LVEGATLRFLGNPESYLPPVLTRWEGIDVWSYSPFVYAYDAENIAITGSGTIDGQGERHFLSWRREQAPIQALLRAMGHDGVPVGERVFVGERRLRPHFVQFHSCRCVLVDGPTFVDSPFWMIHPVYCTDVIVRNITCVSRHINSDGIDPDSSRRVLIENCRFDVGDDGVAIKSGRDRDGWRVGIPSEDIVVRDCTFTGNTGGGVAIGSEMSGGVRNVWIENWTLPTCNHALYFKANLDRGGLIENVYIRNIDVGTTEAAVILTNDYHSYRGGNAPPRFERIWIERLRVQRARTAIAIKGHPMAPVRHVRIRDVDIGDAESALELSQGEDVRLDDVFVNGRRLRLADAVEWQDRKTY
jgi:polygalacturonase